MSKQLRPKSPAARTLIPFASAADQLSVCTRTVERWVADGTLRAYRVGPRLLRVDQDDVTALAKPVLTVRDAL